ncbi:hypothetical protein LCGC14_1082080 [marine sediment metagenome]|uniref:Response regulatory domain-containing protein n=1 Tax=marine sediment metagenome TaxID=412755 RepID=A0A0F9QKU1_9ZZZZ|nr:response regulator [Candidatus Aminicenantes bacterium]HEB34777.1 response regulator [Candidatus Aminicenantes bacterium]
MEKKKILIIDDEEDFCQMMEFNLEDSGKYEVRMETKGKKALAAAKEFKPALIFLDIVMPDIPGDEVAQQLRSDEMTKDIPVVFLTALVRGNEVASQDGIIGGNPFIAKPVSIEKLIDCIEKNTRN